MGGVYPSHLGGKKKDNDEGVVQWLSCCLGGHHEESFLTATTELGFPSIHGMDPSQDLRSIFWHGL
jgi:hypothetical protein